MKFGGIGIPELVIILIVVLLIFGPKNLPKLGSALGKTVKNLREGMGGQGEADEAADEDAEVVEGEAEALEEAAEPVKKASSSEAPRKKKRPATEGEAPKKRVKKPAPAAEEAEGAEEVEA